MNCYTPGCNHEATALDIDDAGRPVCQEHDGTRRWRWEVIEVCLYSRKPVVRTRTEQDARAAKARVEKWTADKEGRQVLYYTVQEVGA